jgi:hypothetical protein
MTLALPLTVIVPTAVAVSFCATVGKEPAVVFADLAAVTKLEAVALFAEPSASIENVMSQVRDGQFFIILKRFG